MDERLSFLPAGAVKVDDKAGKARPRRVRRPRRKAHRALRGDCHRISGGRHLAGAGTEAMWPTVSGTDVSCRRPCSLRLSCAESTARCASIRRAGDTRIPRCENLYPRGGRKVFFGSGFSDGGSGDDKADSDRFYMESQSAEFLSFGLAPRDYLVAAAASFVLFFVSCSRSGGSVCGRSWRRNRGLFSLYRSSYRYRC